MTLQDDNLQAATFFSLGLVPVLLVVLESLRLRVLRFRGRSLPFDEEGEKTMAPNPPLPSDG